MGTSNLVSNGHGVVADRGHLSSAVTSQRFGKQPKLLLAIDRRPSNNKQPELRNRSWRRRRCIACEQSNYGEFSVIVAPDMLLVTL